MSQYVVYRNALIRIFFQQFWNEINDYGRAAVPAFALKDEVGVAHHFIRFLHVFSLKRHFAGNHIVKNYAKGPGVDTIVIEAAVLQLLWCHVADGAAQTLEFLVLSEEHRLAEIGHFQVVNLPVLIDAYEDVVKFNVTMHHSVLVTVLQGLRQLLKHFLQLWLLHLIIKVVHVLTHVHVLGIRYYVKVPLIHIHINELNDVGMVKVVENFQLLYDLLVVTRLHRFLLDLLNGNHDVQLFVYRQYHLWNAPRANLFPEKVLLLDLVIVREVGLQFRTNLELTIVLHQVKAAMLVFRNSTHVIVANQLVYRVAVY